jgi:integrase
MKGKIAYDERMKRWYVSWYFAPHKRTYKIWYYQRIKLYAEEIANQLLACMRSDEHRGIFSIEKYLQNKSEVIPLLWDWLEAEKTSNHGTHANRKSYIKHHLEPFFTKYNVALHEIDYPILMKLLNSMKLKGSTKKNVMNILRSALVYAKKANKIQTLPEFPEKNKYRITESVIRWLPEDRQLAVINAMPKEHQPIFLWLKYHIRRIGEAMALQREDFDGEVFTICRTISAGRLINTTKTKNIYYIPMVEDFKPVYVDMKKQPIISSYFFTNPRAKNPEKRYTKKVLDRLWKKACEDTGENIGLYAGLKHSTCSQLVNEYGYSLSQVQMATDHKTLDSVKKYAKVEIATKKALLDKKIVKFKKHTKG